MNKRTWIVIILAALIINIVSLQMTIEAYYGREYSLVTSMTIVSLISVAVTVIAYFNWHKLEYRK
ncbi:hypothetical protein [Ectobacillus ponti]|uniref:Uncharacterized protein n=1 Tax=Ectobacillus ponti TaxID=2961894 RepID=A0AA41X751_9BACI|nr:hypothetical protein [Ectobacillus ponti]MCP8967523.1 hypothetical protein [Ectobacillus ponti]